MRKIFAVTALIISSQLVAQTTPEEDSIKTLDKVVITATKYPTKQSNTGKLVSVVQIVFKNFCLSAKVSIAFETIIAAIAE